MVIKVARVILGIDLDIMVSKLGTKYGGCKVRLTISVIGRLCGVHNRLINRLNRKHTSEVRVEVAERRHNSRPNQSPVIVVWSLRGRKFPLHQLPNTRDEKEADLVHT